MSTLLSDRNVTTAETTHDLPRAPRVRQALPTVGVTAFLVLLIVIVELARAGA